MFYHKQQLGGEEKFFIPLSSVVQALIVNILLSASTESPLTFPSFLSVC